MRSPYIMYMEECTHRTFGHVKHPGMGRPHLHCKMVVNVTGSGNMLS